MAAPVITSTTANQLTGYIRPEASGPLFAKAQEESVFMRLGRQVPVSDSGEIVPISVGYPAADWVAEGDAKPITAAQSTIVQFQPKKIAVITTFSDELLKQDKLNFMLDDFYASVGTAIARKIDAAGFYGKGSPFSTFIDQSAQAPVVIPATDTVPGDQWRAYVSAVRELVEDDADPSAWAMSPEGKLNVLQAVNGFGQPLFGPNDSLVGFPVETGKGVRGTALPTPDRSKTLGFLGDWDNAIWGVSQALSFSVSKEATLPIGASGAMVSLWQTNLVAVRSEAYVALYVNQRTGKEALVADAPFGNFVRIEKP